MNKGFKRKRGLKFLSVIISFLVIMQSIAVFADNTQGTVASENTDVYYGLLNKLGIVTAEVKAEDAVTKGMYIEYMLNMLKSSIQPAGEQLFFDVPLSSSYADICNTAYAIGLLKGDTDGNAGLENPVTLDEAICISVRALNANVIELNSTDSSFDYKDVATRLGLYKGIDLSSGSTMNGAAVLRLLYNVINSKSISTSNGEDYYIDDITLLEAYYKIYKTQGILENCFYGDIYGGDAESDGIISVNGIRYKCDNLLAKKLLGQQVEIYYSAKTDNSISEVVYMCAENNDTITINVEDIISHKQGSLEYSLNEKTDKKLNLSSQAVTIMNGERVAVGSQGAVIPEHGTVTLVNNNSDSGYDVVIYDNYTISIVSSVNEGKEIIYSQKGELAVLDLKKYEAYRICDKNGNEISISAVAKDSVLNIREYGDERIVEVTVCTDTAEFSVTSMNEEAYLDRTYLYLKDENGNEYITVSDFADISDKNEVITEAEGGIFGKKYKFALNTDGKIAAILEWNETSEFLYGYIMNVAKSSGFGDSVVKLINENNLVMEYSIADKVRVTKGLSSSTISDDEFVSNYAGNGVIRYKVNAEGKIHNVEVTHEGDSETGLRIDRELPDGVDLRNRFNSANKLLGGQVVLNENTRIFFLPADEKNKGDEKWYSASIGVAFSDGQYYPLAVAYKYDNDVYADVLTVSVTRAIERDSPMMLIEDVVETYDPESGIGREALTGYVNGNKMTYFLRDDGIDPSKAPGFVSASGDVIRFETNALGEITELHPIFDCSEGKLYNWLLETSKRYAYYDSCQVYGKMQDILDGKYMHLVNSEDAEQEKYYYPITTETLFYEYDDNARGEAILQIAADDVPTLERNSLEESNVLIVALSTGTRLVVVYK